MIYTATPIAGAFVIKPERLEDERGFFARTYCAREFAEQRAGKPLPDGPDIRRFFQIFTLFWAAYFFLKAAFYFWMAWTLPMGQALAVRSVVGSASMGIMLAFSIALAAVWIGLLPLRAMDCIFMLV